ncbi:MAG: HAD-IA family hydrolase [Rhodospirillales bacterium]|nr:HAD-IA family hydrolase [Rhodospirillales bacterium]
MPRLRALLFDIDGTLTDTEAVHFEAWTRILKPLGRTVARDHYDRNFVGLTSDAIVERNFADIDPVVAKRLPEEKEALFRSLLDRLVPTPGVREFIARARDAGIARAAVTNAPRANAELMLGKLGLIGEMQTLVIGDELAHGKPHPLPYLTALERLGMPANAARVYEDSAAGVRSGVAAGVETVGVDVHSASVGATHPLLALGAKRVIRDFGAETFG